MALDNAGEFTLDKFEFYNNTSTQLNSGTLYITNGGFIEFKNGNKFLFIN